MNEERLPFSSRKAEQAWINYWSMLRRLISERRKQDRDFGDTDLMQKRIRPNPGARPVIR